MTNQGPLHVARFEATFADGSTSVYYCNFLSDGLRAAGETRRPVTVMVEDWGRSYRMAQAGIAKAMSNAKQPAQASEK